MYFVISAFSNHAVVLHNVTPIDLPAQSAVLSDGVVVPCLYDLRCRTIPLLWRGGKRSLTGWFSAYPPFRISLSLSDLDTHAKVLHNVTPFVPLQQTAVLFFNSPIFLIDIFSVFFSLHVSSSIIRIQFNRFIKISNRTRIIL